MFLSYHSALDVSFIPNDENAPLPLSQNYRKLLRRLCSLTKAGGRLPEALHAKEQILEKMCSKLEKDDDNVASLEKHRPAVVTDSYLKSTDVPPADPNEIHQIPPRKEGTKIVEHHGPFRTARVRSGTSTRFHSKDAALGAGPALELTKGQETDLEYSKRELPKQSIGPDDTIRKSRRVVADQLDTSLDNADGEVTSAIQENHNAGKSYGLTTDDPRALTEEVQTPRWDAKPLALTLVAAGGGGYVMWRNRH